MTATLEAHYVKALFKRTPLQQFTRYSDSHTHAGAAYAARFQERPGRAVMWALEEELIRDIFQRMAPRRALDFATGTGRIAATLERCLPGCELHGIDISQDMLTVARRQCRRVTLQEMDGRQALDEFGPEAFDAVSAFRFFANAEPALRETVADQIAQLLEPGGYVVLNNHRNFWSVPYVAMRAAGKRDGSYGARNGDILRLFTDKGFSCVKRYSLGVWPQTDFRALVLPWPVTRAIERFNLRHLSKWHTVGYNTIFVLKKPAHGPDVAD